MQLVRGTCDDCDTAVWLLTRQRPSEVHHDDLRDAGREVLLGDAHLAALPHPPDLRERRLDDLEVDPRRRCHAERCEQDRACRDRVAGQQPLDEALSRVAQHRAHRLSRISIS